MKNYLAKIRHSEGFLVIGAIVCSLLWGSAFPAIRYAHNYFDKDIFQNHLSFAGWRFLIAGLLVLIFISNKKSYLKKCPKTGLLIVALFQVVFQYSLFYWGLNIAPAVLGAILVSTGSFWWVLLAPIVDKNESISSRQFVCLLLGFCGVCLCVMNKQGGGDNYWSSFLFILSSLCGTIAVLYVRPMNKKVPPHFLAGSSLMVGGLLLLVLTGRNSIDFIQKMNLPLLLLTFWLAFVSAAAFSLWYYLVTLFDVPRLSGYRMLIPVFGVLESILFLEDEVLHWHTALGGLVVLAAIFILEKLKRISAKQTSKS